MCRHDQDDHGKHQHAISSDHFENEVKRLEADLNKYKLNEELLEGSSTSSQDLKNLFTRNLNLIHQFNSLVNSSSLQRDQEESCFVSNFDQKRLLNKLKQLESEILKLQTKSNKNLSVNVNDSRLEDKFETKPARFKFKKRTGTTPQTPSESVSNPITNTPSSNSTVVEPIPTHQPFGLDSTCQFILCRPPQPLQPLRSLSLSDLSNLAIDLRQLSPHLSSLALSRIHHLALLVPPLSGSASVHQVSHSLICLVSQQLRTYQCEDLTLLIYTRTNPVIESSTRIKIGPYPEKIFPLKTDFSTSSSIKKESQHNLPKDFDFPSVKSNSISASSPNLSILTSSPFSDQELFDLFLRDQDQEFGVPTSLSIDGNLTVNSNSCFNLSDEAKAILKKL